MSVYNLTLNNTSVYKKHNTLAYNMKKIIPLHNTKRIIFVKNIKQIILVHNTNEIMSVYNV